MHVVDDDEAVRSLAAFLLGSAGLEVAVHATAEAFLRAAEAAPVGCVLTDVRMPEMDGLALQRRLAEIGSRLPVIIMTGHGDVPIAVDALKAGAADFLEKPFDDSHLLDAVRSRHRHQPAHPAAGRRHRRHRRAGSPRSPRGSTRCWNAWSPASRTRRSRTTWAPARAPSRCSAPG